MWKWNVLQLIKMMVLGGKVFCTGGNSTIHKFVIVRVCLNKVKTEMRVKV